MGWLQKQTNQIGSAFQSFIRGLELIEDSYPLEDQSKDLKARLLIEVSLVLREHNEFSLSQQYLLEAIEFSEENNLPSRLWNAYYGMANYFSLNLKDYHASLEYLDKALAVAYEQENQERIWNTLNEKGLVLTELTRFDDARAIFNDIINSEYTDHQSYKFYYRLAHHNIGNTYLIEEDFIEAEGYLVKAMEIPTVPRLAFLTQLDLAEIYHHLGKPNLAVAHALRAEEMYPDIMAIPDNYKLFELMASIYFEIGEFEKSYHYSQKHATENKEFLFTQEELIRIRNIYAMETLAAGFLSSQEQRGNTHYYSLILTILGVLLTCALILGMIRQHYRKQSIKNEILKLYL